MPVLLILLVAELAPVVKNVERRTVSRLMSWAKAAESAQLRATAIRIYQRVLEFDPDQRIARKRLGFRRVKGQWQPDEKAQHEVKARKDVDKRLTKKYSEALQMLEEEHLAEVVRVCAKYGSGEEKRAVLLPLLTTRPRRVDIHEALGHVRIGKNFVRPGLVDLVKRMPEQLTAWRAPSEAKEGPSDFDTAIPGVDALHFRKVVGCDVGSNVEPEKVRAAVARTQQTLRRLLGDEVWNLSPMLFLNAAAYTSMIKALHKDPDKVRLYSRFGDYQSRDFYAIRVWAVADASERYAHAAGHLTMNERTKKTVPWLAEGFGYFMSLELFDRGYISFVSLTESSRKLTFTRPPPATKTRAECAKWLQEQMLAGRAYTLRDVCSRTLNNLDFCASMQAWSFVRFLFLLDPKAMRTFPDVLREQEGGAQVSRTNRALKAAFGKDIKQLEPLWRAFVLEIAAG